MTDLPEVPFAEPDPEMEALVPERFRVCDEASANWFVRKIVEANAYAQRVRAWAVTEDRRARREIEFFLKRFGPELETWLRDELEARGGKQKSVNLPAGRVGYRTKRAQLVVDDKSAAIEWARQHCPDALKQFERLSKMTLHLHLEITGELPDGTRLEPARETLYVR